jgi:hypothetical protein
MMMESDEAERRMHEALKQKEVVQMGGDHAQIGPL